MMNLILFIHHNSSHAGVTLKDAIEQRIQGAKLETFQTFPSFKARLMKYSDFKDKEIVLLLADSKKRLTDLISLLDVLEDKRLILILPDNSKKTISQAHQFFSRYFTHISSTYEDVCDVLSKMINLITMKF